ncbi:hypothetical protein C7999DRAFT_43960 [Corynascus novoguineensis]|uniref:Uncharacterized protein n=1 Tax=Corynascus novoguineensis TaxID=1126955 RepID=A0AAN7CLQ7_9PEZI|nr:hypothetical protein C7999DRAFT_43960 [Corynascus novoguineensis]
MVRRALSHRRGTGLNLEVDTAAPASASYVTIPIIVRTGVTRRESLPHSRHHQLRRSSSVSSRSTVSSSYSSSSVVGSNGCNGAKVPGSMYDGGSVIVDEVEEVEGGSEKGIKAT